MSDNETIRKAIGARLRQARGTRTQRDIATLIAVTPQAISQWEAGRALPDLATQRDLAELLGCRWDELFNPIDGDAA